MVSDNTTVSLPYPLLAPRDINQGGTARSNANILCTSGTDARHRWPLVLRFVKGAIHSAILVPVISHALFAVLVVYIDQILNHNLGLPNTIVGFSPLLQWGQHLNASLDPKLIHRGWSHACTTPL